MASGIRDKVAIIGMGCSKFGERWDSNAEDLMVEAFEECLTDAGVGKDQIQAAWLSTAIEEVHAGKSGVPLAMALRLPYIPVTPWLLPVQVEAPEALIGTIGRVLIETLGTNSLHGRLAMPPAGVQAPMEITA